MTSIANILQRTMTGVLVAGTSCLAVMTVGQTYDLLQRRSRLNKAYKVLAEQGKLPDDVKEATEVIKNLSEDEIQKLIDSTSMPTASNQ